MNRGIFVVLCILSLALCQRAFTEEARATEAAPHVDDEVRVTAQTKNMVNLIKKNPDLGKLALERAAAEKHYNDALKRAFERDEPNK